MRLSILPSSGFLSSDPQGEARALVKFVIGWLLCGLLVWPGLTETRKYRILLLLGSLYQDPIRSTGFYMC